MTPAIATTSPYEPPHDQPKRIHCSLIRIKEVAVRFLLESPIRHLANDTITESIGKL